MIIMEEKICKHCKKPLHVQDLTKRHFLCCKECLPKIKLCSHSKSKNLFLLKDKDLVKTKFLYINNPKNKNRYYNYNDIVKIAVNKYGSLESIDKIKKKDQSRNNKQKELRKKKLIEALKFNKLEFKNYGDCYSYINYGKPSIKQIVQTELEKTKHITKRKMVLGKALAKRGLKFDETNKVCYAYIHEIGCKTIEDCISAVELNEFFRNETDFIKLKEAHSEDVAKDIALKNYLCKNSVPKKIKSTIDNELVVHFD